MILQLETRSTYSHRSDFGVSEGIFRGICFCNLLGVKISTIVGTDELTFASMPLAYARLRREWPWIINITSNANYNKIESIDPKGENPVS